MSLQLVVSQSLKSVMRAQLPNQDRFVHTTGQVSKSKGLQVSRIGMSTYAEVLAAPPLITPARRLKLHCSWHVAEHALRLRPQDSTFKPPKVPESSPLHLAYSPPHWVAQPSAQPHVAAQAWVHTPLMAPHKLPKILAELHSTSWMVH